MSNIRQLKEVCIQSILSGDNKIFKEAFDKFIKSKPNDLNTISHWNNLFRNIFENACSYSNMFAVNTFLNDTKILSDMENNAILYNGIYISSYNGHHNLTKTLLPFFNKELNKQIGIYEHKEDILTNLLESSISGNQPESFELFLDMYNKAGFNNIENINKLLEQSISEDKPWFALRITENFKIKKISDENIPIKFFIYKLSNENIEFLDYILTNKILNVSEKNIELSKKYPNSSYSTLSLEKKLSEELNTKKTERPTKKIKL